jgi:hypothetical protein
MCRATLERIVERMRTTVRWYFGFALLVIGIAAITLVLVNWPSAPILPGADKVQGSLVGALFGAFAGLPLKEIQDRRNKLLLLELLAEEYEETSALQDAVAFEKLEQRCQQLTDRILGV